MEKETGRTEAFSDGIFGVAITLLALEIGVEIKDIEIHHVLEKTTNGELAHYLVELWPKFFCYFNSFAAVLLMWMAHHKIFKMLRTTSNNLMLANGLLLLIIALVPFPTKTVGEFLFTDAQTASVVFFTGYCVVISLVFVLLIQVAKSNNKSLMMPGVDNAVVNEFSKGLFIGFILNVTICIIAFFAPIIGLVLNFCMWIFWAVMGREKKETSKESNEL